MGGVGRMTFIDEVAVARALQGDRAVWAQLTKPERDTAMVRARERRLAEMAENAEWSAVKKVAGPIACWAGPPSILPHAKVPLWLRDVMDAAGYKNCETFMAAARRAAERV